MTEDYYSLFYSRHCGTTGRRQCFPAATRVPNHWIVQGSVCFYFGVAYSNRLPKKSRCENALYMSALFITVSILFSQQGKKKQLNKYTNIIIYFIYLFKFNIIYY